ncbi:MAG TPA: HAMP domain-containing sensor histidine kinase [Acidimicrobiales bacterium]|nr:HAMP domain-containing sensor histidine kinase [Acidimicrobiales bacterium]
MRARFRPLRRRRRARRARIGLRTRISISFALGALALSVALATATYLTVRSSILHQEESSIESTVFANALRVRNALEGNPSQLVAILAQVDASSRPPGAACLGPRATPQCSYSLLLRGGQWHSTQLSPIDLPTSLLDTAIGGTPAEQIFALNGAPVIAVGVPIRAMHAYFVEVFSLDEVARTLRILLASLVAAALATALAGAVLGRWAAKRLMRPLRDVAQAARAIASGRLDTRLETADVSDLAVLASSFNQMVDRLQQRIERDARFTSDVSHELRSPLTTVTAALSVLEARRAGLPERSRQALDLLAAELRRFQRMVVDLLEISRLDGGAEALDLRPTSVARLLSHAVGAADPAVPTAVAPELAGRDVLVDRRRFERIVANLVENAARYAGGATRVAAEACGETAVRICVEDAGPGVPPEERERIFERFARGSHAAGRRGAGDGTGLGLALVAEHTRLLGGRVWVEDRPGGGARFVVELPLAPRGLDELEDGEEYAEDEATGGGAPAPVPLASGDGSPGVAAR